MGAGRFSRPPLYARTPVKRLVKPNQLVLPVVAHRCPQLLTGSRTRLRHRSGTSFVAMPIGGGARSSCSWTGVAAPRSGCRSRTRLPAAVGSGAVREEDEPPLGARKRRQSSTTRAYESGVNNLDRWRGTGAAAARAAATAPSARRPVDQVGWPARACRSILPLLVRGS